MVGGYLTFQGIDGRARWGGTPVEAALPVTMQTVDDRVERPSGVRPVVRLRWSTPSWPASVADLLGYNRVQPREGVEVVVSVGIQPLLPAGRGRSAVFTSNAPHWCPPPFMAWDAVTNHAGPAGGLGGRPPAIGLTPGAIPAIPPSTMALSVACPSSPGHPWRSGPDGDVGGDDARRQADGRRPATQATSWAHMIA